MRRLSKTFALLLSSLCLSSFMSASTPPLPRLFVIGDSISMQYGPALEKLCAGTFVYDRKQDDAGSPKAAGNLDVPTGANGGDSDMVLAYLRHRRAHTPIAADILLLNCGLHDIKTNPKTGEIQVPLARYQSNLRAIVEEARAMKLRLVWVRTTPVFDEIHNTRSTAFHRFARDVAAYNTAADTIMEEAGAPLIDLHAFSLPLLPKGFKDHVHYTPALQEQQAAFIFKQLQAIAAKPSLPRPDFQLRLWDGPAPGVPANPGPEITEAGDRRANISVPTLDVYLPDPAKATGEAIIICAGGAYTRVVAGPRGAGAAARFLPQGIAVFSLKYRVAPPSTDVRRDALADARRALRLVRHRSAEWKINPRRVGVIGFSAGANLTLNLACAPDSAVPAAADPIDRQSSRPDFIGLCCTWPHTQKVTDFAITAALPPAMIFHARDDKSAPFAFGESIVDAFKKAGASVRFEPYATGGHKAFSLPDESATDWPDKFLTWLRALPAARK